MRFDFTHGVLGKHFLILLVRFLEELGRCSSPVRLLKILQRHLSLFLISKQVESLFEILLRLFQFALVRKICELVLVLEAAHLSLTFCRLS